MARMEEQMAVLARSARDAPDAFAKLVPAIGASSMAAARETLERFTQLQAEILSLSRRNTNVASRIHQDCGCKHPAGPLRR